MSIDLKEALPRLRRLLMRRGLPPHEADDVVNEAWLRLHEYEKHHVVAEPEAFLVTTALRLNIDRHRRGEARGEHVLLDEVDLVDPGPDVEELVLRRERDELMVQALMTLDARTRKIFVAIKIVGESYADVARRHRLSIGAVERCIARGMLVLLEHLRGRRE